MGRLIVLILLVVVAVWLIRRALRGRDAKKDLSGNDFLKGELVSCARCGLNLPRAEARPADGKLYCSDDHARLGPGPR